MRNVETAEKCIYLKPGREKSLLRRHPWVFSGAIQRQDDGITSGETVRVCQCDGRFLGYGAYSHLSQIRVRIWTIWESESINREFFQKRIEEAIARRKDLMAQGNSNAWRLVHAESDGLPGVILDLYGKTAVAQLSTAGAERWREVLVAEIQNQLSLDCLIVKPDPEMARMEGLPRETKVIFGNYPTEGMDILENGLRFRLNILEGQKTGFYLDQRRNRAVLREYSRGKRVLDCFSFSGGFGLNALAGEADQVTCVDSSAEALALVRQNCRLNHLDESNLATAEANVFEYLRGLRDRGEQYDLIVLDPPKFAPTKAQAEKAARAYKDINLLALKLLKPGGVLFTFSCSGGINLEFFQKIVAGAALDAGRQLRILRYLHQAEDHPILTDFPEGEYLKGIVGKVE